MGRLPVVLFAALLTAACAKDDEEPVDTGSADGTDGTGADGTGGTTAPTLDLGDLSATLWALPNLDDDNEDGRQDLWTHADDELVPLGFDAGAASALGGGFLRVTMQGSALGLWLEGEHLAHEDGVQALIGSARDLSTLSVEASTFGSAETLLIELLDEAQQPLDSLTVTVRTPPLLLNHHLQAGTLTAAVSVDESGYSNAAMGDDFESVLGDAWLSPFAGLYSYDVWVQDELEFATASLPDRSMQVVIDSIRSTGDRYLDEFPEDQFLGPDVAVHTWGSGGITSQDSFGNLEVSPPVTVDGVDYPFGRIYYGDGGGGLRPTPGLTSMLAAQRVQEPFTLDISWLCVGHVDEFTTFLPDPTAPRGFRLYVSDIHDGYALLEGLDPEFSIPQYRDHGVSTVGELLEDTALRAYNEELQLDGIDPAVEILTEELALTSDEIVRVPGLFERASGCGGTAAALIPGTVNMAVYTNADGTGADLFIPDPFFRDDLTDQSTDPVIAAIEALLPSGTTHHWVDGWDVYHMGLGEVHCGTNVNREQTVDWWTEAAHLVEETP